MFQRGHTREDGQGRTTDWVTERWGKLCSCVGGPQTWCAEVGRCLQGRSLRCPASFMEAESAWEPCQRQRDPFYRPVDSCPHAVLQCTETPSLSENQSAHTHTHSTFWHGKTHNDVFLLFKWEVRWASGRRQVSVRALFMDISSKTSINTPDQGYGKSPKIQWSVWSFITLI